MAKKHLYETISPAQTEEELKFAFVKYFDLPFSTKNRVDLYTEQILFEFKLDENLKNVKILAKTVAQALYYVHRLKFGNDERVISENICVVAKNFAAFFPTEIFSDFYSDRARYDWDLKPSSPCKKLVAALEVADSITRAHVYDLSNFADCLDFEVRMNQTRKRQISLFKLKKQITEKNFYQIFGVWKNLFGAAVLNGRKPSEYFITDIEQGKSSLVDDNSVLFRMSGGERVEKIINPVDYKYFWDRYAKISSAREIIAIRQKMDRLTETPLRRFTGEFYTPLKFADKALDYLARTLGEWWKDKNFRLWDMAAGTGNLEYDLPGEAIKSCYISTLLEDDADYCKLAFKEATVFQYDYLNDDESKLPARLRQDLANPDIKWIIFINPPYATASNFERDPNREDKIGVSKTAVREQMTAENMGAASREVYIQFLYRISKDFVNRQAWLGIFSTPKYINANNDQPFRDKVFRYKFERGFIFSSQNFEGCNGKFPVGFLIWNLSEQMPLESQEILLDVYDSDIEKYAEKTFRPARREEFLNKWVKRPRNTKKFPPMSSALNFAFNKKIPCDRIPDGFLASFLCWNDFLHQNYTSFLSGPYGTAGGMSVTPENFEQYMIMHAVHLIPKLDWLNNRDQFMQPTKPLPREFICDAVIWSLFAPSNQTVSLRNVEYEGEIYRLKNNFYPFTLEEVRGWDCSSIDIVRQTDSEREERFAALWIKNNRSELSAAALAILNSARTIYRKFYAELATLDVARWKIEDWDAGWYQIRMSLGVTIDLSALSAKLEPQIYELGFLRDEVRKFT